MTKRAFTPGQVAETLAIQGLSFLAKEPARLGAFLAESGLGPETIRQAAQNPAFAATDDDGLVGDIRIVALLDRGVEGIAIDMGDRQRCQRAVAHEARGAALAATSGRKIEVSKTIAAKGTRAVHRR